MPTQPAQIVVLGSSLGARLAAVLLARQGKPVIHLCPQVESGAALETAPPLLIRFLDLLDVRTCLRPARPRAVLTPTARSELHGAVNLRDELQREFGNSAGALIEFLDRLEEDAAKLTDLFWGMETVPVSVIQRSLLPAQLLRHGLSGRRLQANAVQATRHLPAEAAAFVETCVGGCSQATFAALSHAELALAWAELSSPQEIATSALNDLLVRRLLGAGGEYRQLDTETRLEMMAGGEVGIIAGGEAFPAAQVLIGNGLPQNLTHLPSLSGGYARRWRLDFLSGRPSQILPDRIVSSLHGGSPLQVRLTASAAPLQGEVSLPFRAAPLSGHEVSDWLEKVFPFCRLQLAEIAPGCQVPAREGFPGRVQSLRLAKGPFWNVSGAALFPALLNTGECLAAMALAARLAG